MRNVISRTAALVLTVVALGPHVLAAQERYVFGGSGGIFGQLIFTGGSLGTVSAFDQGWVKNDNTHDAANPNYLAGVCGASCLSSTASYRDYFEFALPQFTGSVTGATLHLFNPDFTSVNPSETFLVSFLNTTLVSPTVLNTTNANVGGLGIYLSLNSLQTTLGTATVSNGSDGQYVDVVLNSTFINAVNTQNGVNGQNLYLVGRVPLDTVTPEPATLSLMALGLTGIAGSGLRRRKRSR